MNASIIRNAPDFARLQRLADYYRFRQIMGRLMSLTVSCGFFLASTAMQPPANWWGRWDLTVQGLLPLLAGLLLVREACWAGERPGPRRLLMQGLLFTLMGFWEFAFVGAKLGGPILNGFVQFVLIFHGLCDFYWIPEARRLQREQFSEDEFKQMELLCHHMMTAAERSAADVIEFRLHRLDLWKGLLANGWALLLNPLTHETLVVVAHDLAIERGEKCLMNLEPFRIRLIVGTRRLRTIISAISLKKLERWKEEWADENASLPSADQISSRIALPFSTTNRGR